MSRPNSRIVQLTTVSSERYSLMALTETGEVWGAHISHDGTLIWFKLHEPV